MSSLTSSWKSFKNESLSKWDSILRNFLQGPPEANGMVPGSEFRAKKEEGAIADSYMETGEMTTIVPITIPKKRRLKPSEKKKKANFCNICPKPSRLDNMRTHMITKHLSENYIFCQLCPYSINELQQYYLHNFNRHGDQRKLPPRNELDKAEETIKALVRHGIREGNLEDRINYANCRIGQCRFCKSGEVEMLEHAKKHHQARDLYLCPECPYRSRHTHKNVMTHQRRHHPSTKARVVSLAKVFYERMQGIAEFCFEEPGEEKECPPGFLVDGRSIEPKDRIDLRLQTPITCSLCGKTCLEFETHCLRHFLENNPEKNKSEAFIEKQLKATEDTAQIGTSLVEQESLPSLTATKTAGKDWVLREKLSKISLSCFGFDLNGWTKRAYDRHAVKLEEARALIEEWKAKPFWPKVGKGLKSYPCSLCEAQVQAKQFHQHACNKHFGIPLISCPACGKTEKYQRRNVVTHIKKVHPDLKDAEPIDRRKDFKPELIELIKKCFPKYYSEGSLVTKKDDIQFS